MKSLKAEKEQLQQFIEKQKTLLASARQEQKELETAISKMDAILGKSLKLKKDKVQSKQEL